MTRRVERVNVVLRQEISRVLSLELRDPRLHSMMSVTHVQTSPDLGLAKVFVSVMGTDSDKRKTLKTLKSASGYIRRSIAPHLSLRAVPQLIFFLDESIEKGSRLLEAMDELRGGAEAQGVP